MAKSFATLIDEIQSELDDDGTLYTDAKVTIALEDALREISDYEPYVMKETFRLESRTGSDTTGTASKLTDTTNDQFASTDVGKVVYNVTDNTWAVVTAYTSAEVLSISKDIMDADESYRMYNKGCSNKKQINIEDILDYTGPEHGVIAVEYPIGTNRNWEIKGDILTIDIDSDPPDSSDSDADVEVYVWFNKRQRVVQFADWAGTVNGTPSSGATTFTIAAVGSGTDTIAEDTLFTVAGVRGTYRIRYDLELSGGGGTIVFWPGLESAPANGAVVAFIGSTLSRELERVVVELTAVRQGISKAVNATNIGGATAVREFRDRLNLVLSKLETLKRRKPPVTRERYYTGA